MTKRTYCDGCDRSLRADEVNEFGVAWRGPNFKHETREHHLCDVCLAMFIKVHNPMNWPKGLIPS